MPKIAAAIALLLLAWLPSTAQNTPPTSQLCQVRESDEHKAVEAVLEQGQRQVIAAARVSRPDPAGDAARAAGRGEWGLIRAATMMGSPAYGVDCADDPGGRLWQPLTLAYRSFSDIPGSCETRGADKDCAVDVALDRYAPEYNRALVSLPDYPYRDICRPPVPGRRALPNGGPQPPVPPKAIGFRPANDVAHPRTLAEAARRGNIAALDRLARARPQEIGLADPYHMTPLAWAVTYRQPAAALWLARHGADIAGNDCNLLDAPTSPYQLALETGQDSLAEALYRTLPAGRRSPAGARH